MQKYDQEILNTDSGKCLMQKWRRIREVGICPEWKKFESFYQWAMENNYQYGDSLKRFHNDAPYSPSNCYFTDSKKTRCYLKGSSNKDFANLWNKTVNRIRAYYGMPLFQTR